MTQHKHQMPQAYNYTPKHELRVSGLKSNYLEVIMPNNIRAHGRLLGNLFDVFSNRENNKHYISSDEDTNVEQHSGSNDVEKKNMQELENCANASREIGACGLYKWINKTDEI